MVTNGEMRTVFYRRNMVTRKYIVGKLEDCVLLHVLKAWVRLSHGSVNDIHCDDVKLLVIIKQLVMWYVVEC